MSTWTDARPYLNAATSLLTTRLCRPREQRQHESETCPLPRITLTREGAAMLLDNSVGDGQAKTSTAAVGFSCEERIVDAGEMLRRNPDASITHFDDRVRAACRCRDRKPATFRHRVTRVQEQVEEHLLQLVLDAADDDRRAGQFAFD